MKPIDDFILAQSKLHSGKPETIGINLLQGNSFRIVTDASEVSLELMKEVGYDIKIYDVIKAEFKEKK